MANREQRTNREAKKPKKDKVKGATPAPGQKTEAWNPNDSKKK